MAAPNVLSPDSTIHKRLPSRHRLVSALHKSHGGIPLSDAPLVRQNVSLRTCRNKPLTTDTLHGGTWLDRGETSPSVRVPAKERSWNRHLFWCPLGPKSIVLCFRSLSFPHIGPLCPTQSPSTRGDVDCSFSTETTMPPVDLLRLCALPGNKQRPMLDTGVPSRHMPMDADDEPDEQTHTLTCVVLMWMVTFNPVG